MDDEFVAYPYLRRTDVLIALSREGYEKYAGELKDGRDADLRRGPGRPDDEVAGAT